MSFNVRVEPRGTDTWILYPEGRLDTDAASVFEQKINGLLSPATKALILDLAKLTYLNSAGLRVIFKTRKTLSANNAAFIMTNLQPQIQKVFEIVNALADMRVFESIAEVDRYLDGMQKKEIERQQRSGDAFGGDDA